MAERSLILVLHDVAPETWPDYRPFVEAVDALGHVPICWLVVPDFHRRNRLEDHPEFCRMLDSRLARGDELILHGCHHADEAPAPRSPRDWFMRRVFTYEGEFYPLDQVESARRLQHGIELFARQQWPLHGFVAPAWLLGPGARCALATTGLTYTSDPGHLYLLPDYTAVDAPGLVWSARSAWRRGMSRLLGEQMLNRHRRASVLRLGLHPVDMRHEFSRRYWLNLLTRLLEDGRQPMTKIDWLNRYVLASSAVA
jgi:predicted deacetylase